MQHLNSNYRERDVENEVATATRSCSGLMDTFNVRIMRQEVFHDKEAAIEIELFSTVPRTASGQEPMFRLNLI